MDTRYTSEPRLRPQRRASPRAVRRRGNERMGRVWHHDGGSGRCGVAVNLPDLIRYIRIRNM